MNDSGPPSMMETLLESARRDGPSAAGRAKIWAGVAAAAGTAAAAGGAAAGATKLLATGTWLGGAVTVGLAAALIYVGTTAKPAARMQLGVAVAATAEPRAPWTPAAFVVPEPEAVTPSAPATVPTSVTTVRIKRSTTPSTPGPHPVGGLAEEASLVARARAALVRGDATSALRSIDAARSLPARQLEPEELAVRAQALRALGRKREADAADAVLKSQYPLSELIHSH